MSGTPGAGVSNLSGRNEGGMFDPSVECDLEEPGVGYESDIVAIGVGHQ